MENIDVKHLMNIPVSVVPNFSSLACLEVPEKFVWGLGGGVGWFAKSCSCQTQPLCCVEVRVRVGVLTIINIGRGGQILPPPVAKMI